MKSKLKKFLSLTMSICLLMCLCIPANAMGPEGPKQVVGETYTHEDFLEMYDNVTYEEPSNARTTYNSTLTMSGHSFHMGTFRNYDYTNFSCRVSGVSGLLYSHYDWESTYKNYTPLTVHIYTGNSLLSTLRGTTELRFFEGDTVKTATFYNITASGNKAFAFETGSDPFYSSSVVMSSFA